MLVRSQYAGSLKRQSRQIISFSLQLECVDSAADNTAPAPAVEVRHSERNNKHTEGVEILYHVLTQQRGSNDMCLNVDKTQHS